jgi:hypothetical protein
MKRIFALALIVCVGLECGCGSSATKTNLPIATVQAALVGNWSGTAIGAGQTTGLPIQLNVQDFSTTDNFLLTIQFSEFNSSCPDGSVIFGATLRPGPTLANGNTWFDADAPPSDYSDSNYTFSGDGLNLVSSDGAFTSTTSLTGSLELAGLNEVLSSCVPVPTSGEASALYDYSFALTKN